MLNCSKAGLRTAARCGFWIGLLLLSPLAGTSLPAAQTQPSTSDVTAAPEQIRQRLAKAVTAMDRADAAVSLQLAHEAAALWQQTVETQPDATALRATETATADLAVPLLERLLGRWRAGGVAAESIAEVLQLMIISSDGSRVTLLQSSLKGPGYPFVLENSGAAIAARAAVSAGVHDQWRQILRQGAPQPKVEHCILLWLLNDESDNPVEQADVLQQLTSLDLRDLLTQHGLQITHLAMSGLLSRSDLQARHSLNLVHRLAEETRRFGASAVQLRLLRDACIAAAPESYLLDSPARMLEFLTLADFLIEQFAVNDDSSPATRLLTQHYLITSQLCLVHRLPADGLRRFALFRTLQADTNSLTTADLQYVLPLQSIRALSADDRWQLFRMVLESDLWLLTRNMQPQVTTAAFPTASETLCEQYDLLQEIARAAMDCRQQQWLQQLWQDWTVQGDQAAGRGLQVLAKLQGQPSTDFSVKRPGGWLTDEAPELAAHGPICTVIESVPDRVPIQEIRRSAVWHFPWPLSGEFRIRSQVPVAELPVTLPGYAGLMLALEQQGTATLLSCSTAVVQRRQSGWMPQSTSSMIVSELLVAEQQMQQVVSDSVLWSMNPAGESSPWLFLHSDTWQQTAQGQLSIEGMPRIPRSINLLRAMDLRCWSSRASGQSQPALQIDPAAQLDQPPAGAPDWQLQGDVLSARSSLQRAAPLPGFPQVVAPLGQIVYQRPMFAGDRISWEFEYHPGHSHAFPSIGSAVLELHADGVFLNMREPAWWRQLQGFGGRRTLLTPQQLQVPLKVGWNQAQLRRTSSGFQLELNGQQHCEFQWNPDDARFGFCYRRTARELRVRNVEMQGDWPEQFQQSEFQRILQSAVQGTENY